MASKKNIIWHLSAEEATLHKMPRYNTYQTGHGAHGDHKYNRAKEDRRWQDDLRNSW